MSKVTIVGAGFVGSTVAQMIVQKDIADVTLIDIVEGLPQGKALDLMQSASVLGFNSKIIGTNDYKDTKDSDIVVITAGIARKPGMSREDLIGINKKIVTQVVEKIVEESPNAILIVVSNPLDLMCQVALDVSKFPREKVIGMAGVLDTARYKYFISKELDCIPKEIDAMVLGSHGDLMVPLPRLTKIGGISLTELLSQEVVDFIIEKTKNGGAEIVSLLKTGSAFYAPGVSIMEMVKSILDDEKKIMPCSIRLNGEFGIFDVFLGVPIVLGKEGAEKIVEIDLNEEELKNLKKCSEKVKELMIDL